MFWDEQGNWTGQAPIPERSLESLVAGNEGEDVEGFLQWMRKALQWDPEDRPTALGLLGHEWMSRKTKPVEGEDMDVSDEST
jgi:serine/threonine protein kinase